MKGYTTTQERSIYQKTYDAVYQEKYKGIYHRLIKLGENEREARHIAADNAHDIAKCAAEDAAHEYRHIG